MIQPKTKIMTVEIEKWMDEDLEARQKKSGVSKRWQVNKALELYLEKKDSGGSVTKPLTPITR
jgi:hypothetical protein